MGAARRRSLAPTGALPGPRSTSAGVRSPGEAALPRARLTPTQRTEALDLLRLGQRPQQVADAFGVSYWVILRLLKRTAPKLLPKQQPSLSEAQADEARALLAAGWSLRKVGRRFGVSYGAIWRLIQRERAGNPTQQSEGTKAGGETG